MEAGAPAASRDGPPQQQRGHYRRTAKPITPRRRLKDRGQHTPGRVTPTPKPTWRSPASSPTARPAGPHTTGTAPNRYPSGSRPADHPPADPPSQHTLISIAPKIVTRGEPVGRAGGFV